MIRKGNINIEIILKGVRELTCSNAQIYACKLLVIWEFYISCELLQNCWYYHWLRSYLGLFETSMIELFYDKSKGLSC